MDRAKERIGILGGTFDPIHLGHLIIAEQARDQYGLDRVLLIPSGHSYFKDNREQKVLSAQERLEMTRIAAEGYAPFTVSDIEVNRPGNTYSFETLEEIAAANPGAELFFIVGADTVCAMSTWREPARIFNVCTVLAAMREDQVDPAGTGKFGHSQNISHGGLLVGVEQALIFRDQDDPVAEISAPLVVLEYVPAAGVYKKIRPEIDLPAHLREHSHSVSDRTHHMAIGEFRIVVKTQISGRAQKELDLIGGALDEKA